MIFVLALTAATGLALGAWLGVQLMRQQGRILLRMTVIEQQLAKAGKGRAAPTRSALPVGTPAPAFALPDLQAHTITLAGFKGKCLLLIFFNPGCSFCSRMAADLATLPVDADAKSPLPVIITTGKAAVNRDWFGSRGIRCPVLLQPGNEVPAAYRADGTPSGYLIDAEGRIASSLAIGADAILALAGPRPKDSASEHESSLAIHPAMAGTTRSLSESRIARNGLAPGTPAPDFCLPEINGGEVCLTQFRGQSLLLIFSDISCGPCDELARRLMEHGGRLPGGQLLMVSRGDAEEHRRKAAEHGLPFPIVLQMQWEISRLYARFGTPVGYLIGADGLIAAEVAVGAEAIMALLDRGGCSDGTRI